jgi:hypothetical protein
MVKEMEGKDKREMERKKNFLSYFGCITDVGSNNGNYAKKENFFLTIQIVFFD